MSSHAVTEPLARSPQPRAPALAARIDLDGVRLAATVALIAGLAGAVSTVGADLRWLAALGRVVATSGGVPHGVPFAAAPTSHWANTLVAAELVLHALSSWFGERGFVLAQVVAVAACFTILARDARAQGARTGATAVALLLAALGSFTSLALVRVQLFSLVAFPALVALLRADARRPSRRIWLAPALIAAWANLHGAVLMGEVTVIAYLVLSRRRSGPLTAAGVAAVSLLALCLTPAGLASIDYYRGLVTNLAAERGVGQWAPLGAMPFDPVLIAVAVMMLVQVIRRRPALWEAEVGAALVVMTVKAGRDGVWLLLFLAPLVSAAPPLGVRLSGRFVALRAAAANTLPVAGAALAAVLLVVVVAQRPITPGASSSILSRTLALARGEPILADAIPAEQVALAGGRIWAGNPLDAFARPVQAAYLDWVDGSRGAALILANPRIRVVLATAGSAAAASVAADPAFRMASADASAVIFVRRR